MREKMKKKKNMIIGGLLAVVFLMSVGYAAFASNLSITGTANTSSWIIKITNIREKTKTAGVTNEGTSYTDLTANFNCELTLPGDSITYEVTVENQGNIDASLKEVTKSFTNDKYIEVTYSGLVKGQMLYKQGAENSTAVMEVTVTFLDKDYEGTFTDTITSNISINLNFVQEGNNVDPTKKYLVQYDSQGGTPVESRYVNWEEKCLGCYATPKLTGHEFVGWFSKVGGGGTWAVSGRQASEFMESESDEGFILHAYWGEKQYTFIYDTQGSSSNIKSSRYSWTSTNTAKETPSRDGYTFNGWYTSPNGQGLKITDSMSVGDIVQGIYGKYNDVAGGTNGNEVTLYANWTENEYTISYDSRGGSEINQTTKLKYTNTITLPESPTMEGYTFDCWRTMAPSKKGKARGNIVTDGMQLSEFLESESDSEITLYAYWIKNE